MLRRTRTYGTMAPERPFSEWPWRAGYRTAQRDVWGVDFQIHPQLRREAYDRFPAYYRMNTVKRLNRACAGTSLEVERIGRFADQGYFGFSTTARSLATACDWSLEHAASGWGRIYLTVVCRKNGSTTARSY